MMNYFNKTKSYIFGFLLILFALSPLVSDASSLLMSPSAATKNVGERFTVNVITKSTDQAMNAVSANINFSNEYLELVSISQSNSIIDFWSKEPSFSNTSGTISLEGVAFNGYFGSAGNIATLVFRTKKKGVASIDFSSGDVLANDGVGTSILSGLGNAKITIKDAVIKEVADPIPSEPPVAGDVYAVISSPTHPTESRWYSNANPIIEWDLPESVIDVDFVVTDSPAFEYEKGVSKGRIDHVNLTNFENGQYHIHVIFKTEDGWGPSIPFRFNVDVEAAESFYIQEVYRSIRYGQQATFMFESEDKDSGVSHYRIALDGEYVEDWKGGENETYVTPILPAGVHNMIVQVVDNVGNTREQNFIFRIADLGGGIGLRDYIEFGIIFILFVLIIVLLARYAHVVRIYKELVDSSGLSIKNRKEAEKRRKLTTKIENIQKTRKELLALEAKIQKELNNVKD